MRNNLTLPPPHVMKALTETYPYPKEPHHRNQVEEPCCQPWETAHMLGTCSEGAHWLVWSSTHTGLPVIGTDLPPVRYCPWCGHSKTKKRRVR
jgi:hypothetical protein